jgi:hypothetical protein
VDRGVEGERGEDRALGGGVVAADVGGRVGLGVAERLRLGEHVGVGGALLGHPGEDVVGGAVEDADHPRDPVAGERLLQRLDDRDRAGDRGLVGEVDAGGVGAAAYSSGPSWATSSLLAVTTGLPSSSARRISGPAGSRPPMTSTTTSTSSASTTAQGSVVKTSAAAAGRGRGSRSRTATRVTSSFAPGPRGDVVGLAVEDRDDTATDGAAAEQADADDTVHGDGGVGRKPRRR